MLAGLYNSVQVDEYTAKIHNKNHAFTMKLSMNLLFFVVYDNNYSMEGISLDFHCLKALNDNLEARLFYMFIFMPHQIF